MTDLERPGAGDLEPVRARSTACHCGRTIEQRSPDPWDGRMDDYCYDCASNRCDCYPDECPVKYPQGSSAAQGRPWWSYIPVVNLVILWAKYGWEGFE